MRDSIITLRDGMTRAWLEPVQADVEALKQAAAGLGGATVEERQRAFENRASDIRGRARNIAARSNQLGKSTGAEMRALASAVNVGPGKAGFSCYDPTLAERLTLAAAQSEQPAELKLRQAVFNEGPAGVANAVKNLWSNMGAYGMSLGRYVFSGGNVALGRTDTGEPITGRDLIALLATIGIDLGLLALAIVNPPKQLPIRFGGDQARQVAGAINTAMSRAKADRHWLQGHFIHHRDASYLVIPNLYAADQANAEESARALAMNHLAGVLTDLQLLRWPTPKELKALREEEGASSTTDLSEIRRKWREEKGLDAQGLPEHNDRPIRNHGLFSKAEHALHIGGWSEKARNDVEVFPLIDTEGLTPILMVLNDGGDASRTPPAAATT